MTSAKSHHLVIVGAGVASLAAAVDAASQGVSVTLLEKDSRLGGKAQGLELSYNADERVMFDSGPTVFTMPWVFEELFARSGRVLSDYVTFDRADTIARHAFADGSVLDLFADASRSRDAIGAFAGAKEAAAFDRFCAHIRETYAAVEHRVMRAPRPSLWDLTKNLGVDAPSLVGKVDAHRSMWKALQSFFQDPRLIQLFGRYATYVGGSPFEAPATLNLIAHVEGEGVYRARGGMRALMAALARLAQERGVVVRTQAEAARIELTDAAGLWSRGRRARGVTLVSGEFIEADAVLFNGDIGALGAGLLGEPVRRAVDAPKVADRSLSAVTTYIYGVAQGFELSHHNVFFSSDYEREFDELFTQGRPPSEPTVYVCAQDRDERHVPAPGQAERLFILMNAPATGDQPQHWSQGARKKCYEAWTRVLERSGLSIQTLASEERTPVEWAARLPATGGAIYGQRPKGAFSALSRPGACTSIQGLYLAGGSVHPGPGVPMAALSGTLAAAQVIQDLRATSRSKTVAISGTTSTA